MKITVANTSGFCFGVNRAITTIEKLLDNGKKVCTLGPIIHNPEVVRGLALRGVQIVDSPGSVPKDAVMVLRSHGVTEPVMDYLKQNQIDYFDATCPFVKKIHYIVKSSLKSVLLAAGNANHPEMVGIRSYFLGKSFVYKDFSELKKIIEENKNLKNSSVVMVAQTTFSKTEWAKCTKLAKDIFTNIEIYDTICNTTSLRQKEAENLSKNSDIMVVIGGKNSSNTLKLYNICKKNTKTILIESPNELNVSDIKNANTLGIVAGASTPLYMVKTAMQLIEAIN